LNIESRGYRIAVFNRTTRVVVLKGVGSAFCAGLDLKDAMKRHAERREPPGVTEPRKGPIEFSVDRTGGDYRNFEVAASPSGSACKAACEAENKCRAWTYLRAGYITPFPRCYLKDRITPPRHKPCCISGVVR